MKARWAKHRLLILRTLGTLAAVAMLVTLFDEQGWNEVADALRRISPAEFLLALAALLLSRLFVVARWHVLLRSAGTAIRFRRTASLTFTGLFASNFLPTTIGGDLVRLTGALRMGFDRGVCLASLVVDRLVGMLGMFLVLPFGLLPFLGSVNATGVQAIGFGGLGRKISGLLRQTLDAFSIWIKKPVDLLAALLCTLGNMVFIFISISILTTGLHDSVPFMLIAGLWSLTYFVTQIPISINGYGVQELSLSFLLARVGGMGNAESLTVAILIRAIFIFASLPGVVYLPRIMEAVALARAEEEAL
jgi:hypothetical protein